MEFNKAYYSYKIPKRKPIPKTTNIMQEGNSRFFQNVKTEDLKNMSDGEVDDNCCCATKALAYELFHFAKQNAQFPYESEAVKRRLPNKNLTIHEMRSFNEMAIKIMRRFDK